jgi:tripartite-type tricarboxylate transporter receptor subunit TctC
VDWKVVVAPAGTPQEVIRQLNTAIQKSMRSPSLIEKLREEASAPMYGDPEEVKKYIRTEQAQWDIAVKAAGINFD